MFLKRLEIVGFKSFADRITIDFVPGVTAVVGPNGSGKSNITDAVRWVLGEQSAKSLRGSKMEDVIFAGSDTRKPLNFAEVTLVLDNEDEFLPLDYNEVSVTRRVTRSGESEFFINKQPCRLRDIVELFMDSGLGRESFSMIGQGRVEEILNSKPEDRRSIFEEAAGVLKYKTRKKKAEARLAETEENLHRVNDILHELEHQVEPLKIQASIAKDYLQKKEDLEKVEVACIVYEIEELHKRWEKLSRELEQHQNDEMQQSAELQKKEARLAELRDQITALDESINDLQNVLLAASEELEKLEGQKKVLKERKKNAAQNQHQLKQTIMEITERLQSLQNERERLKQETEAYKKDADTLKQSLAVKQKELNELADNVDERIDSLKTDYIDYLNSQAATKNELQYIEQQVKQYEARLQRLTQENEKYLRTRAEFEKERKNLENELKRVEDELDKQVQAFQMEKRTIESQKQKYSKLESNLYQAYKILQQAKSRKEMLETMQEDYAGFFQGVKEVLKAKNTVLHGIEGAVAELIEVPQKLEKAIETALGSAAQHIVTEDERSARDAIAYLKKHRYGRATFLPLNIIKGKSLSSAQVQLLQTDHRFVGIAADLIHVNEKYRSIISNLLGHVVITTDLKAANDLAKKLGYRLRIVTLDGDVVNPGGSMTGGAGKQKTVSILSRKNELETLKQEIAIMEQKTVEAEKKVKNLKAEIQSRESHLEEMRKSGEKLRLRRQEWKAKWRENDLAFTNLNEKLAVYDLEKSEYEREKKALKERKQTLLQTLESTESTLKQINAELERLTKQKHHEKESKEKLQNAISDLKASLAVKKEQLAARRKELQRVETEMEAAANKKKQLENELNFLQSEMANSEDGEAQVEEAAKQKAQDKEETVRLISLRREERVKLQQIMEDEELELKELKRIHKGLSEVIQDEKVKINRLDVELENRLSVLNQEYKLTFEAAKANYPLTVSIEEARKQIKLIKLAIEELGTVNLGAIEEYKRISERYSFLLEQKNDLQEAKETLYRVISEMDQEMARRFEETFTAIRQQFGSVFSTLFGGGRAELKLTDPSDLLTTGVEIIAQPPGKKLQNLGLLSGGERALTAIALLFSILKVRPVPFCIMDEVEAALDEANVFRFSHYLKQFSEDTQFIVITHRKGTMEEADVLYGVTMQESGVSKLVSVRLEETKDLLKV
jgi:chromosome segregation protein